MLFLRHPIVKHWILCNFPESTKPGVCVSIVNLEPSVSSHSLQEDLATLADLSLPAGLWDQVLEIPVCNIFREQFLCIPKMFTLFISYTHYSLESNVIEKCIQVPKLLLIPPVQLTIHDFLTKLLEMCHLRSIVWVCLPNY